MGALSFMGAVRPRSITMTSAEKKAIYAALAKPFDEHCIQRTEGRFGVDPVPWKVSGFCGQAAARWYFLS